MKVYYKIPDSDNDYETKVIGMLYEIYSLKIQLALAPAARIFDKSLGIIFIEGSETAIDIRFEGFKPDDELIAKYLIGKIPKKRKARQ